MIPASAKPYGPRLRIGCGVKLKGAVLCQEPLQWPFWSQFWGAWNWPLIKTILDQLATIGINCIQVTADGLADGGWPWPDDDMMVSRIRQLSAYTQSLGMVLNPQLAYLPNTQFATSIAAGTTAAAHMAELFVENAPNIAFIDAMNEVNNNNNVVWPTGLAGSAVADMTTYCTAIRAVIGQAPLTVSINAVSAMDWLQAMAPLCDFHDVHTYEYSWVAPAVSNFAALRAASWYLGGFVVGETGMPRTPGSSGGSYTADQQQTWFTGNGTVASALDDCYGSILWGANRTSESPLDTLGWNPSTYGMLSADGTAFYSGIKDGVAGWPGKL